MYNLYELNLRDLRIGSLPSGNLPKSLENNLNLFLQRLAELCLSHQQNRIGIKNIGNIIRFDKEINSFFDNNFVRATRNNSELLQFFLNTLKCSDSKDVCFVFFSEVFREESKLVDNSSIALKHWNEMLNTFNGLVNFNSFEKHVYLVEIFGISGYYFVKSLENESFSRIVKG